jgi:hypothetical protein
MGGYDYSGFLMCADVIFVFFDENTIYNLEAIWQMHQENGHFNIAIHREHLVTYWLFIRYTFCPQNSCIGFQENARTQDISNNYCPITPILPTNQPTPCLGYQHICSEFEYIQFFKKNSIRCLPRYINDYIFDFLLHKQVTFQMKIENCIEYPFVPSKITLANHYHYSGLLSSSSEYEKKAKQYEDIIEDNICIRNNSWSPAITMEKQILSFVSNLIL